MRVYQLDFYTEYGDNYVWINSFIKECSTLNSVKSLLRYYVEINKVLSLKHYKCIEYIFDILIVTDLSDVLLVGLLRLCFLHKNEIKNYVAFREKCKTELLKRNYDINIVLRGIL